MHMNLSEFTIHSFTPKRNNMNPTNLPKIARLLLLTGMLSTTSLQCMNNTTDDQEFDLSIDCSCPETVYMSIDNLIKNSNSTQPEISLMLKQALQDANKTLLSVEPGGYAHQTITHIACCKNNAACLKILLTVAKEMNDDKKTLQALLFAKDCAGCTPLHMCCVHGNTECLRILLHEASELDEDQKSLATLLEMQSNCRNNPLHLSYSERHIKCAKMLEGTAIGIDPSYSFFTKLRNAKNYRGQTVVEIIDAFVHAEMTRMATEECKNTIR